MYTHYGCVSVIPIDRARRDNCSTETGDTSCVPLHLAQTDTHLHMRSITPSSPPSSADL